LRELRDELEQTTESRCQQNTVDKSSSLSEKRLDVLLRKLNDLKKANVSYVLSVIAKIVSYL